jgi:hypothetical protein
MTDRGEAPCAHARRIRPKAAKGAKSAKQKTRPHEGQEIANAAWSSWHPWHPSRSFLRGRYTRQSTQPFPRLRFHRLNLEFLAGADEGPLRNPGPTRCLGQVI